MDEVRHLEMETELGTGIFEGWVNHIGYRVESITKSRWRCSQLLDDSFIDTKEKVWERQTYIGHSASLTGALFICQKHYEKHHLNWWQRLLNIYDRLKWKWQDYRNTKNYGC